MQNEIDGLKNKLGQLIEKANKKLEKIETDWGNLENLRDEMEIWQGELDEYEDVEDAKDDTVSTLKQWLEELEA